MILCEAYNKINSKGLTAWMAWGMLKWNDGYCICDSSYIKRHPHLPYIYIIKGEEFYY